MYSSSIALTAMAVLSLSGAAMAEDYYAGKTIDINIGFSPGGGVDTYSRLLAEHLPKHIPGAPEVIVRNMPGAGGAIAVQSLIPAPKDGLTMAFFIPDIVLQGIVAPDKAPVDHTQYTWIGSVADDPKVCYVWAGRGIESWNDMLSADEVVMGASGPGGSTYANQMMLDMMWGVKLKQIIGYPGTAERRLAIENGELDGDCGSWTSVPADWLRDEKINVVLSFLDGVEGLPEGVTYASDLVSGEEQTSLLEFLNAPARIGRAYVVHKDVPAEAVEILRNAFDATVADPEFLKGAEELNLIVAPTPGAEVESQVEAVAKVAKPVLEQATEILGSW